jgi:integrase
MWVTDRWIWVTMNHLVIRKQTYHYRRRVPGDVQALIGQKFWKQSLKTGNFRDAEIRARALGVQHDRIIKGLRELPEIEKLRLRRDMLERRQVEAVLKITSAEKGERWEATTKHRAAARRFHNERIDAEEAVKGVLASTVEGGSATLDELNALELERLHEPVIRAALKGQPFGDNQPPHFKTMHAHYSELSDSQRKRALEKIEDRAALRPAREQRLREKLKPIEQTSFFNEIRDDPNNPRIQTAAELWYATKKQGAAAVKRHRVAVRRFVELFENVPVREITRQMVQDYIDRVANLADHRKLPSDQRGGLADFEELPRISAKTVERHLVTVKAFLTFCKSKGWIVENVASGVPPPKDARPKASKRRSLTREERHQVLARSVEENGENGDITWLIKLAAYTGCRLEELAQLARTNVKQVDGVWVIEIDDLDGRNVKSDSGVRMVPLHPAIRDDFVKWVKEGRGERVFMSFKTEHGRYANRLSGDFGRLMDRAGLSDPRLVFHSLRHGLKRAMSDARLDIEARRAILGHATKDAHGEYEGHSLAALADELARVPVLF